MKAVHSAFCTSHSALGGWLPDMDLNHDKQIQSLLCYRYTIGQAGAPKLITAFAQSRPHFPMVAYVSRFQATRNTQRNT